MSQQEQEQGMAQEQQAESTAMTQWLARAMATLAQQAEVSHQAAPRPPQPLTHPVPGVWMAPPWDGPAVYVPDERIEEKSKDAEGREISRVRFERSTHVKRLVSEGWMPASAPTSGTPEQQMPARGNRAAAEEEIARLQAANEQLMAELAAIRAHMATDASVPTASKRR